MVICILSVIFVRSYTYVRLTDVIYWQNKLWFPRMSTLKSPDSHDGCSGRSARVSSWLTVSAPFTRVISQNISTRHTQHYEIQHFISEYFSWHCMYFLRGLLKSLKSCDVTKVFGFSVKLVFRRKRHKAIRIWCVLVPRRRESQNLVRMGSWGEGMLNDHLYASFGKITLGNRLFTIFGDSFCLKTSNKWDDLNSFRPHKNLWIKCSGLN